MQPLLEGVTESRGQSETSVGAIRHSVSASDRLRSLWPEWLTLSLYTALVAFAIPYHEPFVDEAQGWQLARSLPLTTLFHTYIRYEGSPGLWHFLVWILIRLHVSYTGLHWICGAIAVAATSLFLFKSPFPRYLKLILPFTYFLLFQYAVIARNYVLVPLLMYAIALCWKRRPILIALLLGLLANVALHAAVISGGLAIVYAIVQIREGAVKKGSLRSEFMVSAVLLLSFYAFAIWTAWPPHDLTMSRAVGGQHSFFIYAIASLVLGMCQPWLLSIPFWIVIALCFNARRSLLYLLPLPLFAIFSGIASANFWHMGLLVPLLICLFWITWPAPGSHASAPGSRASRYETAAYVALIYLAGVQILWSAYSVTYDHFHEYAADRATAEFLKPLLRNGETIGLTFLNNPADHAFTDDPQDADYLSIGLLPYFNYNIFANQPYTFWSWSTKNSTEALFFKVLPSRPRIVLVEEVKATPSPLNLNNPKIKLLTGDGYRLTNIFCGTMPQQLNLRLNGCHLIFQYFGETKSPPIAMNSLTGTTGYEAR